MSQLGNAKEKAWLTEFCRLLGPRVNIESLYPPSGDPDNHEIDAIVCEKRDGGAVLNAVEITCCYQGGPGEARLERDIVEKLCLMLGQVCAQEIGDPQPILVFTIYFAQPVAALRKELHRLVREGSQRGVGREFAAILKKACKDATTLGPQMLGLASASPEIRGLIEPASQIYVDGSSPGPYWSFHLHEPYRSHSGWETHRGVITLDFGITHDSLLRAAAEKRGNLEKYRNSASNFGAAEVSLLLVAERTFGLDAIVAAREAARILKPVGPSALEFDEIYLLARGPFAPEGISIKQVFNGSHRGDRWKLWTLRSCRA